MNMDAILDYTRDPNEDFYQVLGCHRLSTTEQIQTEFKIRAKECHPDKQKNITESNPERFQLLLKAKNTLVDPVERKHYDSWLDSGLAVSFAKWRGLNDTVKTSMHWATPKTERMIDQRHADTPPKPAPPEEEDDDGGDDGVTYEPTPYETLGYRVPSPVDEWKTGEGAAAAATAPKKETSEESLVRQQSTTADTSTAQKRKQFAVRRESSIGAMLMTNKFADDDLRMKFRTYEI